MAPIKKNDARNRLQEMRRKKPANKRRITGGGGGDGGGSGGRANGRGPRRGRQSTNRASVVIKSGRIARVSTGGRIGKKKPARPIKDLRQVIQSHKPDPRRRPTRPTTTVKKRIIIERDGSKTVITTRKPTAPISGQLKGTRQMVADRLVPSKAGPGRRNDRPKPRPDRVFTAQVAAAPAPQMIVVTPSSMGPAVPTNVIVTNLNPSISQADMEELFADAGPVASVQMINESTSLITFYDPKSAVNAVHKYNNRLLDGLPMQVTVVPVAPVANIAGTHAVSTIRQRMGGSSR